MAIYRRLRPLLFLAVILFLGFSVLLLPSVQPRVRFQPSSFNWSAVPQKHPATSIKHLPTGAVFLPRVQHDFPNYRQTPTDNARQQAVRDVFQRAWQSYRQRAWGHDELRPISGGRKTSFAGWGLTLVDSLDTLWIMGLRDDFYATAAEIARLDWAKTAYPSINLFETNIRYLGGILSAYDLSGEPALLEKAAELGEMLYMGFDTPNRLPVSLFDFADAVVGNQQAGDAESPASAGTISLEFTRLAQLTGDHKFFDAIDRVTRFFERTQNHTLLPGLWPNRVDYRGEGAGAGDIFTLGASTDSLYEYFPKMHALLGGLDSKYAPLYRISMEAAVVHLLFRPMLPGGEDILFAGDASIGVAGVRRHTSGQHLSCFAGGMFGLGGKLFGIDDHVDIGNRLSRGCAWAYSAFPTGIMPERFSTLACEALNESCPFDEEAWERKADRRLANGFVSVEDPRYLLRPEAIESIFLLYRMTGAADLRDIAWRMFQSVAAATKTKFANAEVVDVTVTGEIEHSDSMESFWFSETLKYFYLIFSPPDLINLDEFVFNTEGHPFRLPT